MLVSTCVWLLAPEDQIEAVQRKVEGLVQVYFEASENTLKTNNWVVSVSDVEKYMDASWKMYVETDDSVVDGEKVVVRISMVASDQFEGEFVGFNPAVDVEWVTTGEEMISYWQSQSDQWSEGVGVVHNRLRAAPSVSEADFGV